MDKKRESGVRVRIAPSPTGYPHIGTIYQALFNYAFAHRYGGKFLVRIEDTDRARLVEDAEEAIFSALDWFGLTEDESVRFDNVYGPYRQSERLSLYHKYAQKLIEAGGGEFAYYPKAEAGKKTYEQNESKGTVVKESHASLSPKTVQEMVSDKEKFSDWVVRLVVPENKIIVVEDGIRGKVEFDSNEVSPQVLLKSDGYPTYHLAVVVDDHSMEITDVLRGEEWLSSAPKHVLIYDYLAWEKPRFYHTAVLRNPDKSKLSKRQGHTNVSWYQQEGYLPEAILNFLALLSWSHPDEKEIFSLDEFIRLFDFDDIKPVGPVFDINKLSWMNGEYIRKMNTKELHTRVCEFDPDFKKYDEKTTLKLVELSQTRMKTLKEFKDLVSPFFEKHESDLSGKEKELRKELFKVLSNVRTWEINTLIDALKSFVKANDSNFKMLYRIILEKDKGLPLADVFEIMGKEKTLQLLS